MSTAQLRLNFTVASDRGLVRGNNEDSAYAGPNLLVLADGMGGHAAGEVASQLMVNYLKRLDADPEGNDMLALLGGVADDANHQIAHTIQEKPETDGMGTTLTGLMFDGTEFGLIHVGDSRGYRLRDGKLEQITKDDTYVQSLVDAGELDAEDVSSHPQKSLILKAYTGIPVEPTLRHLDARPGDRLLLCSDGLSDPVTATTIEATLREGSPGDAARRLIELALRSGGPDNITVVVADVVDEHSLDELERAALASSPVEGGALLGEVEEGTHPDTSAGRAALLRRQPQEISPDGTITPQQSAGFSAPEASSGEEQAPAGGRFSGSFRWAALILGLLALIGLVAAGWWTYAAVDRTYFVSTGEDEQLVVEHGVDYSIFGRPLHSTFQLSCLNQAGDVQLVDVDSSDPCTPFTIKDLPESARSSVTGLQTGSYDEITQQLRRLADQALPECLSTPGGGELTRPGVNCREVASS